MYSMNSKGENIICYICLTIKMKLRIVRIKWIFSYPERWRDWPDETQQPRCRC